MCHSSHLMEGATDHQLTPAQQRVIALIDSGEGAVLQFSALHIDSLLMTAAELTYSFAQGLELATFDPRALVSVDWAALDLVSVLECDTGPGLTNEQFRRLICRCTLCHNVCLKGRQEFHRCRRKISLAWNGGVHDLVRHLLSTSLNPGLSHFDLRRQFVHCGLCSNICISRRLPLHQCPLPDHW